jgi:predicted GNAT superfamily acetyltransferase
MPTTAAAAPILPVAPADLDASPTLARSLRALNNAHATELSRLEADRLRQLVGAAFLAARIGANEAFLLAFDQDAAYDSPNFLWFRDRFDRFVYVDRIVVAPQARGRGHARRLYGELTARARAAAQPRIVCEVNAVPPNPASDAFHAAFGFEPVGSAPLPGGDKIVRYLSLDIRAAAEVTS